MKSILILCNSLNTGGAEKQTIALANGLYRNGWEVLFVYLNPSENLLNEFDEGLKKNDILFQRSRYLDFKVVKKIRILLNTNSVNKILAVNQCPIMYAAAVKLFDRKIKVYAGFHSTKLSHKEAIKFYLSSWWFFKFVNKVVYVCAAQKRFWSLRGLHLPGRGHYIYNGIDTARFQIPSLESGITCRQSLQIPESATVLASIALLRPEKMHLDMVRVVSQAVAKGGDIYLLCVGDGPEKQNIITLADQLGVADRIKMIGRVSDVRPYISASDAVLLLSKSETFSMAILESLSCGCPVIAYDVGGVKEQVVSGLNGWVCDYGDQQGVVDSILAIKSAVGAISKDDMSREVKQKFSEASMESGYQKLFLS